MPALIGMVHVRALPGSPGHAMDVAEIAKIAADEARVLEKAGFDGVIIENMHDRPYVARRVGSEVISAMTRVGLAVREAVSVPIGVQILAGANRAALSVAQAIDAQFIRAEGFVFASIADEGLLGRADAAGLLRHRKRIGADHVAILADVKKKHSSHAITADVSLVETVHAAEFFLADGVIVTGAATGVATEVDELGEAKGATRMPVLAGSGATVQNVRQMMNACDGVIVGSALKIDGDWRNSLDAKRCDAMVAAAKK
ncbi:MAG: BtpA/SgcQ family protein [Planctomycetota bacterium]|nr:BtpA/SgcQ family protein [Planctomycetota bacterium]